HGSKEKITTAPNLRCRFLRLRRRTGRSRGRTSKMLLVETGEARIGRFGPRGNIPPDCRLEHATDRNDFVIPCPTRPLIASSEIETCTWHLDCLVPGAESRRGLDMKHHVRICARIYIVGFLAVGSCADPFGFDPPKRTPPDDPCPASVEWLPHTPPLQLFK